MSSRVYWPIYVTLLAWFILSGFHVVSTSIWVPIAFMVVLDWYLTRLSTLRYVFAAIVMVAVFAVMMITISVASGEPAWVRAACEVGLLLVAFGAYQFVLWRTVLGESSS